MMWNESMHVKSPRWPSPVTAVIMMFLLGGGVACAADDPEEDTPQRLKEYTQQYQAGQQWQFYTGTVHESITMQRAFDSYGGDKMNHSAVSFMRFAPGKSWLRIDGFASPDELAKEYWLLAAAR
jgi:cytochrome oxidase Cu insertion factor (SCO1/SenC/PrrC family)